MQQVRTRQCAATRAEPGSPARGVLRWLTRTTPNRRRAQRLDELDRLRSFRATTGAAPGRRRGATRLRNRPGASMALEAELRRAPPPPPSIGIHLRHPQPLRRHPHRLPTQPRINLRHIRPILRLPLQAPRDDLAKRDRQIRRQHNGAAAAKQSQRLAPRERSHKSVTPSAHTSLAVEQLPSRASGGSYTDNALTSSTSPTERIASLASVN